MKLGITGTQDGMTEAQFESVKQFLLHALEVIEIHGGDCIGFDAECILLSKEIRPDIKTIGHPPSNPKKRAFLTYDELREELDYHTRNHNIVDGTAFMLACPKGPEYDEDGKWIGLRSGTWSTIRYAIKRRKPVVIIMPDGTWHNK